MVVVVVVVEVVVVVVVVVVDIFDGGVVWGGVPASKTLPVMKRR